MYNQNSPVHSDKNLLCAHLTGRALRVKCSPMSCRPCPQSLELSNFGEHVAFPTTPSFMMPMLAPDRNLRMSHSTDQVVCGYYTGQTPMYAPGIPRFPGYFPVSDGGSAVDEHDALMSTTYQQPLESLLDFGGVYSEPVAAHQPPIPPVTPEQPTSSGPAFFYHPCRWLGGPQCDGQAPGRNREMAEHLRSSHRFVGHERDQVQCQWEGCGQLMQRMNVPRHIVSRHLLAAAACRFCGRRFSRPDVVARHERTCGVSPLSSGPISRV